MTLSPVKWLGESKEKGIISVSKWTYKCDRNISSGHVYWQANVIFSIQKERKHACLFVGFYVEKYLQLLV